MTNFQFRLATLLKLRENERQQRQVELGQALDAERIMQEKVNNVSAEIVMAKSQLRHASSPGAVAVDSLLEFQRYALQLKSQARVVAEQLQRVRAEVERRRQVLTEADRQVRMLEKLREKQASAFRREAERREQLLLDEVAQQKTVVALVGARREPT